VWSHWAATSALRCSADGIHGAFIIRKSLTTKLEVDATPTFFINGERLKGSMSFEEFESKLVSHLKR
jgi:Thioredoxin